MLLTIQRKRVEPDIEVLELAGKISLGRESQKIEWEVEEMLRQHKKKIILDLSQVDYIDSTGVGILALCSGKLREAGGELRVAGAKGIVEGVLKIVRSNSFVASYPTTAEAAAGFGSPGTRPAGE